MNNLQFPSAIVLCLLFANLTFSFDSPFITDESDNILGKGVHAFFDRNYEEAVKIMSKAEELDVEDPRPYYFLGLAFLRQKENEKAEQYLRKAAQLEFNGHALRDYAVSEALRRIQGTERMRIEMIRSEERTNARIREQRVREARYGIENAAARDTLRQSLSANQKDDLLDLQDDIDELGDNVFGLRQIDPFGTQESGVREGSIAARRTDGNPFGTVTVSTTELPPTDVPEVAAAPSFSRPVANSGRRTFVNVDVAPMGRSAGSGGDSMDFIRSAQTEAARQAGRMLGAFFTGKSN